MPQLRIAGIPVTQHSFQPEDRYCAPRFELAWHFFRRLASFWMRIPRHQGLNRPIISHSQFSAQRATLGVSRLWLAAVMHAAFEEILVIVETRVRILLLEGLNAVLQNIEGRLLRGGPFPKTLHTCRVIRCSKQALMLTREVGDMLQLSINHSSHFRPFHHLSLTLPTRPNLLPSDVADSRS